MRIYVERDVRRIAGVGDAGLFARFVGLCAAHSAQEINHSQLGRELGVTYHTAQRWLAILRATFQWLEVPPFSNNLRSAYPGALHSPHGPQPSCRRMDPGPADWIARPRGSGRKLAHHVVQDAAVLVVLPLLRRVDADPRIELRPVSVR